MQDKSIVSAVIVAAGKSSRMNGEDKQFRLIGGMPVLARSILAFEKAGRIDEIVVVTRPESVGLVESLVKQYAFTKVEAIVTGGETRAASVLRGIRATNPGVRYLAVHDGARPLVDPNDIDRCVLDARCYKAAFLGVKVKDTVKLAENATVISTPDRERLYITQTPQIFEKEPYLSALEKVDAASLTDDCAVLESAGFEVHVTQGSYENIKLTTAEDFAVAEEIIAAREGRNRGGADMKIGQGYDVHRLVEGRQLILGGVHIPYGKGLLGHSDADVLVHAIMDAILGALALGDIGLHFPDNAPRYKGADSMALLKEVVRLAKEAGYRVGNLDSTVVAQEPKLRPYIDEMRKNIASACGVDVAAVSIKATTEEGMGFTGAKEGIAAQAVCLLRN